MMDEVLGRFKFICFFFKSFSCPIKANFFFFW